MPNTALPHVGGPLRDWSQLRRRPTLRPHDKCTTTLTDKHVPDAAVPGGESHAKDRSTTGQADATEAVQRSGAKPAFCATRCSIRKAAPIPSSTGRAFARSLKGAFCAAIHDESTGDLLLVADARLEYRGKGYIDEAQRMGWLTRFFLTAMPF